MPTTAERRAASVGKRGTSAIKKSPSPEPWSPPKRNRASPPNAEDEARFKAIKIEPPGSIPFVTSPRSQTKPQTEKKGPHNMNVSPAEKTGGGSSVGVSRQRGGKGGKDVSEGGVSLGRVEEGFGDRLDGVNDTRKRRNTCPDLGSKMKGQ